MKDPREDQEVPITEVYIVKPLYEYGEVRIFDSFLAAAQSFGWDLDKNHSIHITGHDQVWEVNGAPQWSELDANTDYEIKKAFLYGSVDVNQDDEALAELRRKLTQ